MTLISAPTLSISEFAGFVEAAHGFAPLEPCPRSASPELRGAPLRRMSGAPSSRRARVRSPSPESHDYDYDCYNRADYYCPSSSSGRVGFDSSRRSSASGASGQSAISSAMSEENGMFDTEDDGIIWFGRRTPRCAQREEQFWNWVEDAEPPTMNSTSRTAPRTSHKEHTHNRSRSTAVEPSPKSTSRAPPALWSRMFVLWRSRLRVHGSHSSGSRGATVRSLSGKSKSPHRRTATCP